MSRECGECRMCCTTAEVVELGKAPGVQCQHVCSGGCAIYDRRPSACEAFRCSYLGGDLPDDVQYRPSEIGLMIETMWLDKPDGGRLTVLAGMADAKTAEGALRLLAPIVKADQVVSITIAEDHSMMVLGGTDETAYYQQWLRHIAKQGYVEALYADGVKKRTDF